MAAHNPSEVGIGTSVHYRNIFYNDKEFKVPVGNYCNPVLQRAGLGAGSSGRRGTNNLLVRSLNANSGAATSATTDAGPQALNTSVNANDVFPDEPSKTDFTNKKENLEAEDVPLEPRYDELAKQDPKNPLNPGGGKIVASLKRSGPPPFKPDSDPAVQAAVAASLPPPPKKRKKRPPTGAAAATYHRFRVE
jgi:hypothetical protein